MDEVVFVRKNIELHIGRSLVDEEWNEIVRELDKFFNILVEEKI